MLLRMSLRPQFSVFIATSLDGYIARPDGGIDWLRAVERPGEDYGYQAFARSIDAIVMGRNTYEVALGFPEWPYAGKRLIVLTHRPAIARHGEEFCSTLLPELGERLAQEGVRRVYVDGGEVIRQFLVARLIDDLTVSIIPVLLGSGIPLFGSGAPEHALSLLESRSYPSGLVQLRYGTEPRSS